MNCDVMKGTVWVIGRHNPLATNSIKEDIKKALSYWGFLG